MTEAAVILGVGLFVNGASLAVIGLSRPATSSGSFMVEWACMVVGSMLVAAGLVL
jgi:hypothetical protein